MDQPRIWRIAFHDVDGPEATIDTVGGGTITFTGLLADKLRRLNEAVVRFETEKRWVEGRDVLDDIREALR